MDRGGTHWCNLCPEEMGIGLGAWGVTEEEEGPVAPERTLVFRGWRQLTRGRIWKKIKTRHSGVRERWEHQYPTPKHTLKPISATHTYPTDLHTPTHCTLTCMLLTITPNPHSAHALHTPLVTHPPTHLVVLHTHTHSDPHTHASTPKPDTLSGSARDPETLACSRRRDVIDAY